MPGPPGRGNSDKTIFYFYWAAAHGTPSPRPKPPQPTSLTVPNPLRASTSSNRVVLRWGNISNETGFLIERRRAGSTSYGEIAKTTAGTTSYTDVLTTTDVNYEYRVRAYEAKGAMTYSPYTNTALSTTPCD